MDVLIFRFPDQTGTDKILHLLACYIITLLTAFVCQFFIDPGTSIAIGMGAAMAVGFGKELYDKFVLKSHIDDIDLVFDCLGMALAAIAMSVFV